MTIEEILTGESKNIEFKVRRPDKTIKYMKTVIAFANGKGGKIIIGIDDKTREVIGVPKDIVFQEMDAFANAISDCCEPAIIPDIYLQEYEDKTIIVIEINIGKQRPYYLKKEGMTEGTYMRVSGTSRHADSNNIKEMYYTSEGRSFDSVMRSEINISSEEIDDFTSKLKNVALANCKDDAQRQSVKTLTKNVLLNWGVLAEETDGSFHPTNAYILLTGQDRFTTRIQCGMFKGNSRAVFVDKRDYEGPLWEQAEDAFQFVLRNIHLGAEIEGIYRNDIYELPPNSIRELIVNAIMNCGFIQSSSIQIAIFDDRLEITSPGGLMPSVTVERMKEGYSQIRNRALAHVFSYLNLAESWGTGIPRLIQELKEYGLPEPVFEDTELALRISLYRKQINENTNTRVITERVPESAGECRRVPESAEEWLTNTELSEQQLLIYNELIDNREITTSQVEILLGVKARRARIILKEMTEKRIIKKIGGAQTTKYILIK